MDPFARSRRLRPAAVAVGLAGLAALAAGCDRWVAAPVSVTPDGSSAGNGQSVQPVVSPDGTRVAFTSTAADLGPTDTNGRRDVYLRDLDSGVTSLVSVDEAGTNSGNHDSVEPVFSPDGTSIAFISRASDLGATDANDDWDVYLRDLDSGTTTIVSVGADRRAAHGEGPTFSPDGTRIAFWSWGSIFGPTDTNSSSDVYVRDLAAGTTDLVSVNATGTDSGSQFSINPAFSPDGTKIAFQSQADDLDADVLNWKIGSDVFYRDLVGGYTVTVSTDATRTEDASGSSFSPVWSPDSRKLAFWSEASDMGPGDQNGLTDLYLHDVRSGGRWRLPVDVPQGLSEMPGGQVPGTWAAPDFSADGTRITFVSWTNDLYPGDYDGEPEVFVYSLADRRFSQAAFLPGGWVYAPRFNADGSKVVFVSTGAHTGITDHNGTAPDVYVAGLTSPGLQLVSSTNNPLRSGNAGSYEPVFAAGDRIVFVSEASDLPSTDVNGQADVYVATFVPGDDTAG